MKETTILLSELAKGIAISSGTVTTASSVFTETVSPGAFVPPPKKRGRKATEKVTEELLEKVSTESPDGEKEKKPIFEGTMKHITLNGYFKVSVAVYSILKRNITRGVNTLLLGPTGVN